MILTIWKSNLPKQHAKFIYYSDLRAAIIWNSLPVLTKSKQTYESFKRELRTNSKIIENINFGQTATISNFNSDFIFY